jgi:hypothetical protein
MNAMNNNPLFFVSLCEMCDLNDLWDVTVFRFNYCDRLAIL